MIEQNNSKEEKGRDTKNKVKSNADVSVGQGTSLSINIKKDNKSIREKYIDAYYSDNFLESIF
jgi:hypothetical protein